MRELKFRAFQKECEFTGEPVMYEWDSLAFEEYAPICELLESTEHFILMQYTGLKDKNDKEICEGDIIKIPEMYELNKYSGPGIKSFKGELGFIFKSFAGFNIRHISSVGKNEDMVNIIHKGYGMIDNYDLWNYQRNFEIIGNIHENKDLL